MYNITEEKVTNYTTEISYDKNNFRITNTHITENTTITVTKVWNDNKNQDGIRSSEITISLKANGQKIGNATIKEENDWKYTFTNLPKYQDGKEINYTVEETNIPTEYNVSYSEDTLTITNKHTPKTTEITISKIWDDKNNQDGIRPNSVTVYLFANGVKVDEASLSNKNDWKATFNDLPMNKEGKAIKYTVTEAEISDYTTNITEDNCSFIVTNTHIPETINLTINKVWDDKDNYYGKRPSSVTVNIYSNGEFLESITLNKENNWNYVINNLPKFKDGKQIDYTITEDGVKGYNSSIEVNNHYEFTITNSYKEEIPPKNKTPSKPVPKPPIKIGVSYATGNPVFLLLVVLITLSMNSLYRRKK